ncbi:NADP-dependent oxidoreductase [Curtobacterium sp. MCBD17_003]|uniref:NADP-dependent oxidoreductase n=1 Tax=Curtobacterium sp. MCBD17_003 TaxID=2175667 RepID=UPI0021AC7119|nr:NADP-dependent oxidoreductase [Curtobacterium sp. MCBD17_003]WIE54496.1 NADP-dependent oxidoreductase [Curtobacterium sp. MCBD17_003]
MTDSTPDNHTPTTARDADLPTTMRAVRFDAYGERSVLRVDEVPVPEATGDRVLVRVRAAGTNPGEAAIRQGAMAEQFPATFPSGQGTDLAGVVAAIGEDVTQWTVGDEVLGWSWERSSQAEFVSVPEGQLVAKPRRLSWEIAGALDVAATTAYAAVRAVDPRPGETVVVSSAAGGVGGIVTQLLVAKGVDVIAVASEANHEWLRSVGARPVAYGDGLEDRVRQAGTNGIDALIDTHGPEYVRLGIALGVPAARIETIIAYEAAAEVGAKTDGSVDAASQEVLAELAGQAADGTITVPIIATYPLDAVQDAYAELEQGHARGKIVLVP